MAAVIGFCTEDRVGSPVQYKPRGGINPMSGHGSDARKWRARSATTGRHLQPARRDQPTSAWQCLIRI